MQPCHESPLRAWASEGRGRESLGPLDFEIWYFAINALVEKCFSLNFGIGKTTFHHCPPPVLEKILSTPVTLDQGGPVNNNDWKVTRLPQNCRTSELRLQSPVTAQRRSREPAVYRQRNDCCAFNTLPPRLLCVELCKLFELTSVFYLLCLVRNHSQAMSSLVIWPYLALRRNPLICEGHEPTNSWRSNNSLSRLF